MTGQYIVAEIDKHDPIEGADKIAKVYKFGETLIVDKQSNPVGTRGIVIDCLSVLGESVCHHLNMFRRSELNSDKDKVGYIENNCRVRAIKLRGVKCSGLFISFKQLLQHPDITEADINSLKVGSQGNTIGQVHICTQFVRQPKRSGGGAKAGRVRENLVPTFREHIDTDQLARNLSKITDGSYCIITEKLHGTSGRFGYLPVIQTKWYDNLLRKLRGQPRTVYQNVVGSRRVTKSIGGEEKAGSDHFYGDDIWTQTSHEYFAEKLHKGETVYFEIVGFLPDGQAIMPSTGNKKLKPFLEKDEYNEFVRLYGDNTNFTYGCAPKEHKIFVYRITMTNEDGHSVDYNWDAVKHRCEEMGVDHVPELARCTVATDGNGQELRDVLDNFHDQCRALAESPSELFRTHLREGVCVRVDNGATPLILKEKAYNFKVLEGIIKETQDTIEDEQSE